MDKANTARPETNMHLYISFLFFIFVLRETKNGNTDTRREEVYKKEHKQHRLPLCTPQFDFSAFFIFVKANGSFALKVVLCML